MPQIHTARLYCCQELLWQSAAETGTCGVVAVSLVSPAIVGPVAVVGVEQIDVLVVVAGQELCRREGEERVRRFTTRQRERGCSAGQNPGLNRAHGFQPFPFIPHSV